MADADIYVKIGDVKGEGTNKDHKGEIQALSWGWGASQSIHAHSGGGSGGGKATLSDLYFVHHVDSASPTLFQGCVTNVEYDKAVLTVRRSGATYLRLTLEGVSISHLSQQGSGGGEFPTESVTLSFKKILQEYITQGKGNVKGATVSANYDVVEDGSK